MNELVTLDSKPAIEAFLRRDAGLHVYGLGDLDELFWPDTKWHGLAAGGAVRAMFLEYRSPAVTVLLALEEHDRDAAGELLELLSPSLPDRFYCHASPHLVPRLFRKFRLAPHGRHLKMVLAAPGRLPAATVYDEGMRVLGEADLCAIRNLYAEAYPGNWFDARMLATGRYMGVFDQDRLVSIAGVHVFSKAYRVAALGNIATHPGHRGKGMGGAVTSALCRRLERDADLIGLNVRADNATAVRCYAKIGFREHAEYDEFMVFR